MKTGKTILGILFLAIVLVVLLKDWSCNQPTVATSVIDSLANVIRAKDDSIYRVAIEYDRLILEKNYQHAQDSAAVGRALAIIKPTTEKLRAAIAANTELKRRNDTLERLQNCDTLAWYAGLQSDQIDALKDSLEQQRQGTRDLMTIYGAALDAANDKAIEVTKQRDQYERLAREAVRVAAPVQDSRLTIGIQAGYGLSGSGTGPYIGIGFGYRLLSLKKLSK